MRAIDESARSVAPGDRFFGGDGPDDVLLAEGERQVVFILCRSTADAQKLSRAVKTRDREHSETAGKEAEECGAISHAHHVYMQIKK